LFIVIGIGTALGWPWVIGHKPASTAPVAQQLDFLTKGMVVVCISVVAFVFAGIGAILVVRQAREEYNEARTEMLKELIEGTQEDIRNKQHVDA
jgi:hypothetical protein